MQQNKLGYYFIALLFGLILGFKFIPYNTFGIIYLTTAAICIIAAFFGKVPLVFKILPFLVYSEPLMRAQLKTLPYLTVPYTVIAVFTALLLVSGKKKPHTYLFVLLVAYCLLEVLNGLRPLKADNTRGILANSFALCLAVTWGCFNVLTPKLINTLLNYIKYASVYLAGVVMVAHLQGGINYGTYSSSEASNGLAPVQLSGYFGVASSLFFIAFMNVEEKKKRLMNISIFAIITTVMILTLSRGGLYFVVAIILMYLFYHRAQLGNYFKFLLLLPIGLGIYNFTVKETKGVVVQRYQDKNTSNRDVLVLAGFTLFERNVLLGVGTGNYNVAIKKEGLFGVESGAHNEFVRAIAEHGVVGLVIYWGFFLGVAIMILNRRGPNREFTSYFIALFCLISIHNGLKIGIQPLLMMMAFALPNYSTINQSNVAKSAHISAKKRFRKVS